MKKPNSYTSISLCYHQEVFNILCNMSSFDEDIPLHEDSEWTFKQSNNLVELDDFDACNTDDLIGTGFNLNSPGTGFNRNSPGTGFNLNNPGTDFDRNSPAGTGFNLNRQDVGTGFNLKNPNVGTSFNLIEPDLGSSFNLIEPDISSAGRRKDDWEEDSLSSNEWGPLVADELTFEPFTRR